MMKMKQGSKYYILDTYSDESAWVNAEIYLGMLEEAFKDFEGVYVEGSLGLWNGRRYGFVFLEDFGSLLDRSYQDIEIYIDNNGLHLTGYHHDGTNYLTIYGIKEGKTESLKSKLRSAPRDEVKLGYYTVKGSKIVNEYMKLGLKGVR